MTYLDTHVLAWAFAGRVDLLPAPVRGHLESDDLLVSPMAVLELQYLYEIGRATTPARQVLDALAEDLGIRVCDLPFPAVGDAALRQSWTRDPFDRVIVAQAALRDAPLLTRDETIRRHYRLAEWG